MTTTATKTLKLKWFSSDDGTHGTKQLTIPADWNERRFVAECKAIAPQACDGTWVTWRNFWNICEWPDGVTEQIAGEYLEIDAEETLCDCEEN